MESSAVLFSVVCPTFNRSRLLPRAINSVLRQHFQDFELIIVNDGSTDDTKEVVKQYNDKRIVYVEHEENRGLSAACNTGFGKARGKYITKLDDDDELGRLALQTAMDTHRKLHDKDVKVLFFNSIDVDKMLIGGKSLPRETPISYQDLLCQKLRGDYWVVVERSVLATEAILDENTWSDLGRLWLRLLRDFEGYFVPEVCLLCHKDNQRPRLSNFESNSRNLRIHQYSTKVLLEEFGADMKRLCRETYSKQLAILAFYQSLNGNRREARSNLVRSLRNHSSVFAFGLLLLTLLGNEKSTLFVYERFLKGYSSRVFY